MINLIIEFYHRPDIHPYFLILFATFAGGLLGFERQLSGHKEVGRRTLSLVSIGSCLYTILPMITGHVEDPWRMGAQVITGIGFIGGGVLLKEGGSIKGITTASAIWLSAALGVCFAADKIILGFFCTLVGFLILRLKDPFDFFNNKEIVEK